MFKRFSIHPVKVDTYIFFVGFLLIILAFFGWNSVIELRAEEPRRAIVTMEMMLSQNYLVPKLNGWLYYNKPPLFNWVMALFFKLFGSFDEWVVRLPSLLAFLTTAVLNYFIVKRFLKKEVAILSSLFFLTSADLLFYGTINTGEIDLFFSLLVYVQVMAIFWFSEKKQFGRMFLISYLMAAAGTLTKGPPSIAFQGLTLFPWLILIKEWKWLFSWKHIVGIVAYAVVVGGYFYWYSTESDPVPYMVRLFKEASQRTGLEHNFFDTILGVTSFPLFLLKILAPWSLLVILWFRKNVFNEIRSNHLLRFCLVFILFNIPLYWISGDHKSRYMYMFIPFFCVVLSYFFFNVNKDTGKWRAYIIKIFFGAMILVMLVFLAAPFLPLTAELPFISLKSAAFILVGAFLAYAFLKYSEYKIYFFVLFILLVRIGFNFTYLPILAEKSDSLIYRDKMKEILKITKDEAIHWYDVPYYNESDVSIGPVSFQKVKIAAGPLMAYQIPYYITKGNQHILKFDQTLEPNRYYLARTDFLKSNNESVRVLYSFTDRAIDKEIVLFKTNPSGE